MLPPPARFPPTSLARLQHPPSTPIPSSPVPPPTFDSLVHLTSHVALMPNPPPFILSLDSPTHLHFVLSPSIHTPHRPSSPHARVCIGFPSPITSISFASSLLSFATHLPSICAAVSSYTPSSTTARRLHRTSDIPCSSSSVPSFSSHTSSIPPSSSSASLSS
ncbi:hypothetical protein B0H13DRAFT_2649440 [Mycena leptocephala]|nr:hypothetical protein B0H13DRAFT_2649440 [Mycena leptocephala]